jgi:flagellar motor switch protein FliN
MSSSPNSLSSSDLSAPEFRPYRDVVCNVEIVLGTGSLSVRECLHLKRHAVIRLTQTAGSDLHVLVNGVEVAHGEIVIVDDSTAVRITEILQPPSTDSAS